MQPSLQLCNAFVDLAVQELGNRHLCHKLVGTQAGDTMGGCTCRMISKYLSAEGQLS
jgi:hypothetical protein